MKNERRKSCRALESGQTWQMKGSNLRVELVGKRLVHYRLLRPGVKRAPAAISARDVVEQYLVDNQAILIQQ
jgi:hypothetical protein